MTYSSARQEKHFQPWRLYVAWVEQTSRYSASAWKEWYLVKHNEVTHETERLSKIGTKAEALKAAKEAAVRLSLPFNLQGDIVPLKTLKKGPVVRCVACGEELWTCNGRKHGREPELCRSCTEALKIGKAQREELQEFPITERLLPYTDTDQSLFLAALVALAKSALSGRCKVQPSNSIGGWQSSSTVWGYMLHISDRQADALRTITRIVSRYGDECERKGYEKGTSVLQRLAGGHINANEVGESRIG